MFGHAITAGPWRHGDDCLPDRWGQLEEVEHLAEPWWRHLKPNGQPTEAQARFPVEHLAVFLCTPQQLLYPRRAFRLNPRYPRLRPLRDGETPPKGSFY